MGLGFAIIIGMVLWAIVDLVLGARKRRNSLSISRHSTTEKIDFIADGEDFFEMLLKDVDAAERHIHMMFYIFRDDETGLRVIDHLCEKASQGVRVIVLADLAGSHGLKKKTIQRMTASGVRFSYSRKIYFPRIFTTLNERNHRKITIIDGKIGYIGGFNAGNEYAGKDPKFGYWRDYHLRVIGEAVNDLQHQFLVDWQAENEVIDDHIYTPLPTGNHASVKFHITNGSGGEESFSSYIDGATSSIVIGTPYYIPGRMVQNSLLNAIKRGVSVILILPMKADHPLVKEASFHYLVELIQAGGKVYQYMNGFYHAKVMIIDDRICDIGTANFDQRSFHINGEINCILECPEVLKTIKKVIKMDLLQSERLDLDRLKKRTIGNRLLDPIARLLSPFL
ncbi:cardiolipin synthase [Pseudalkalibacillus hwajinpoensis]|uniref:cardiolipin synthase n=1 Tax=Guptibacillus hwajinpoensis TaxID=208199 RepID=UPI00325C1784